MKWYCHTVLLLGTICFVVLSTGCTADNAEDNREGVIQAGTEVLYDIEFHPEQTFGGREDDLLGRIGGVSVDDRGQVYISDQQKLAVWRYGSDGVQHGSYGSEGDGPGEFRSVRSTAIQNGRLYVLDRNRQQIQLFSVDNFQHRRTINLDFARHKTSANLEGARVTDFSIRNSDELLLEFSKTYDAKERRLIYHILKNGETLSSSPVLNVKDASIFADRSGDIPVAMLLPFERRTLVLHGHNFDIFTAWTEDFEIEWHTPDGHHKQTLSAPITNADLGRREVIAGYGNESIRNVVSNAEFPETWPALNDLLADDENRLWVSTIVEDFEVHEWWVLEESGELITRFEWPRDEPIEVVKNGYMYTRQTDEETGLQQVVRYRMELEETGRN